MGCKVLCPSFALLAYLMICEHVRAQCTQSSFEPRNVIVTAQHLLTQSFADGDTVTIQCIVGYKPVDSKASKSVTCKGGQWENLVFSCTKKSCGALPDITHGRYEMSGNLFGDTAKPVCDTGYVLAGQEITRLCRDQGWDGRHAVCEPVTCSAPPAIENGQLADVPLDFYDYSQAVSYKCNEGFNLIGSSTIHCSEDGTFKPNPPTCFDGCPTPRIPNAKRIGGRSPPYKLNHFIEFECEVGYKMKGVSYIVCKENGWSPEPPQCIALPTTTTGATSATSTTSTTSTTSKDVNKNDEGTADERPDSKLVPALVGVGSVVGVGGVIGFVYWFIMKRSKQQNSRKMDSNSAVI